MIFTVTVVMKQSWLNGFSTVFNSNTVKVIVRQPFSVTVIVRDPSSVSTERNPYGTGFYFTQLLSVLCNRPTSVLYSIDLCLCCTLQIYVCVVQTDDCVVLYGLMSVLYYICITITVCYLCLGVCKG